MNLSSRNPFPPSATFQAAPEEGVLESGPLSNMLEEPEDSSDEGEEQARSA
jgi:hypothetical protein